MIRIAIVEDNKTTREGLQTIISLSPEYQCVCACATVEEALQALPARQPQVVLMDIQLPGMSGIDCVAQIKRVLPDVQVIMVTVYEDPDRIFRALRAGASGYLLKRATPEQVLSAVRDVQQGGAPMSGEIARKALAHFRTQQPALIQLDQLSPCERQVLELVERGFSNQEIAGRISVSPETIRLHLKQIYHKLHLHSRTVAPLALGAQAGSGNASAVAGGAQSSSSARPDFSGSRRAGALRSATTEALPESPNSLRPKTTHLGS